MIRHGHINLVPCWVLIYFWYLTLLCLLESGLLLIRDGVLPLQHLFEQQQIPEVKNCNNKGIVAIYACTFTCGHSFTVLSARAILISFSSVSPTLLSLYYYYLIIIIIVIKIMAAAAAVSFSRSRKLKVKWTNQMSNDVLECKRRAQELQWATKVLRHLVVKFNF